MTRFAILVCLATAGVLVATPAGAAECVGRCDGPGAAAREVSAGACEPPAVCRAGCDGGGPGSPHPYAECVTPDGRPAVVRPQVEGPGGTRE